MNEVCLMKEEEAGMSVMSWSSSSLLSLPSVSLPPVSYPSSLILSQNEVTSRLLMSDERHKLPLSLSVSSCLLKKMNEGMNWPSHKWSPKRRVLSVMLIPIKYCYSIEVLRFENPRHQQTRQESSPERIHFGKEWRRKQGRKKMRKCIKILLLKDTSYSFINFMCTIFSRDYKFCCGYNFVCFMSFIYFILIYYSNYHFHLPIPSQE